MSALSDDAVLATEECVLSVSKAESEFRSSFAMETRSRSGSAQVSDVPIDVQSPGRAGRAVVMGSAQDSTPTVVEEEQNQNVEDAKEDELFRPVIGPQHFDLLKLIGEGAFGKVIMVRNRLNKEMYAMKVIRKRLLKKRNNQAYMKSERDILTKIDHPFIVQLWFAFQTEQRLFLVMDFLGGGELFYHLKKRGLILEEESRV